MNPETHPFTFPKNGVCSLNDKPKPLFTVRDNIHGVIELPQIAGEIVMTPEYQRLRDIKQLGSSSLVYSGAVHTRYEHCIGVAHMAQSVLDRLIASGGGKLKLEGDERQNIILAGLTHDLGHSIFSHLFDGVVVPRLLAKRGFSRENLNGWTHEVASEDMLKFIVDENHIDISPDNLRSICNLVTNSTPISLVKEKPWLYEIIANKRNSIDVDKFDYIMRDAKNIGLTNIFVDIPGLVKSMKVIDQDQICFAQDSHDNLYNLFHSRLKLFKTVYMHRVATGLDEMFADVLLLADQEYNFLEKLSSPQEYARLTDNIFQEIQYKGRRADAPLCLKQARDILLRVKKRDLYKFVGEAIIHNDNYALVKEIEANKTLFLAYDETHSLKEADVVIQCLSFNFGAKDKNPVSKVHFYDPQIPSLKKKIDPNTVSMMIPSTFQEHVIRVFTKNRDQMQETRQCFINFCEKKLKTTPKPDKQSTPVSHQKLLGRHLPSIPYDELQ